MSEPALEGENGEVRMVIEVTRAATGETETYVLTGRITEEDRD